MSDRLLLDPGQAASPLATGRQTTAGGDDKPQTVDISQGADHWYVIREGGRDDRFLFTPLPGGAPGATRYAFAVGGAGGYISGVAVRRAGAVYIDLPFCDTPAAQAAAAAHGVVPTAPAATAGKAARAIPPSCTFTDAAALTGALGDYADHADPKRDLVHLPAAPD